ncbi:uncharacterized protein LOC142526638 isoform X1 [Primulina tabacum]|uniref:uncharacterized protein LOC142526638 isoform X1 n=1 Tax=Primulina tabacum TaxID=48773 RepID=UPI003F5ACC31
MGCGKSKQAVATDNTVTITKSSNSIKINNPVVEKATEEENVQEFGNVKKNDSPDALIKKVEYNENIETKENTKEKDGADGNGESRADDKAKKVEEGEKFVENEQGKLNSDDHSPRNFLSPIRDQEETIEFIISEGISGKSEYYSPRAKGHVHEQKTEWNDAVEGEAKAKKKNEEGNKVEEGKEVVIMDETKESASTGEEKTLDGTKNLS